MPKDPGKGEEVRRLGNGGETLRIAQNKFGLQPKKVEDFGSKKFGFRPREEVRRVGNGGETLQIAQNKFGLQPKTLRILAQKGSDSDRTYSPTMRGPPGNGRNRLGLNPNDLYLAPNGSTYCAASSF